MNAVKREFNLGDTFYYLDDDGLPIKSVVRNFDENYKKYNFCECSDCVLREGTMYAHWKFDHAIDFGQALTKDGIKQLLAIIKESKIIEMDQLINSIDDL
jgi:2-succinyl-5-enolpyruvyl-6-hydroxy-3-cyclohexene-1-carboxylate synthase